MSELTHSAVVVSLADVRAAKAAREFTDQIRQAEAQLEGDKLSLRQQVFYRNLPFFSERITNAAYGRVSFKLVRLQVSGMLAIAMDTDPMDCIIALDEDTLEINHAIDPIVTSWRTSYPCDYPISEEPVYELLDDEEPGQ